MIDVDAAGRTALVAPARALLGASLIATRVVSLGHQLAAVQLAIHVAAPALHLCSVWACRTWPCVT